MTTNKKKVQILCDYCNTKKDANQIFTEKKHFAGVKIFELLHIVSRCTIPATIPLKICSMCASTLHVTTGNMAKSVEVVTRLLAGATDENQKIETDANTKANVEGVDAIIEAPPHVGQSSHKKKTAIKNKSLNNETLSAVQHFGKTNMLLTSTPIAAPLTLTNGTPTTVQQSGKANLKKTSTPMAAPSSPSKPQCLDTSLQNVVKLTPAKDEPKKAKAFNQLFGTNLNNTDDSYDEDDDEDNDDTAQKSVAKDITKNFVCKNCDYTSVYPVAMKKHYREIHGLMRPRIFDCLACPKTFGRVISLRIHMKEHGLEEVNSKMPNPVPELATLTALKPNPLAKVDDISFNVAATLSSTQKFTVDQQQKLICDICHLEFSQVKPLQEHLITVHDIANPKVFKCSLCPSSYKVKWSLDRHVREKHINGDKKNANTEPDKKIKVRRLTTEKNPVSKIKQRRKTVAVEMVAAMEPADNVDENFSDIIMEDDFHDILEKPFKDPVEEPIKNHIKSESASPSKCKTKDNSQLDKPTTVTPKQPKSAVLAEFETDETLPSPIKQMPKENGAHTELKPNTPKKKKKPKTDMLDSSQSATTVTNGTPKKASKRKSETQLENVSQEDIANTTANESKTQEHKNSDIETIDLIDEINTNVKPHKRAKLDSINESELSCSICSKVVPSRKRLDSHMQKRHATQLACPTCNSSYTDKKQYISHFDNCYASDVLACGVYKCKKSFLSADYLTSHLKKKHNVN